MQSEPTRAEMEKAKPSFLSRFFHRFGRSTDIRTTPEIRARLNAPAQLFIWQPNGETDDSQIFDSLREAVAHAPEDPAVRTFIVTENGHILRPAQLTTPRFLMERV